MESDMRILGVGTDATLSYRETSAVSITRMDNTGDLGSLATIMRDSVIILTQGQQKDASVPTSPAGDLRTVVR